MRKPPITFQPLYMQRVWGGRQLEVKYSRNLPDDSPYGESWEMVDRADEQSVVTAGPFKGKTLHELWTQHREEIFGADLPNSDRFPLLIKILDARKDLSVQVHPPVELAAELDGEPKTEMWYVAEAEKDAKLYIGLRHGTSREDFEQAINEGTVEKLVHEVRPQVGDSILIRSGRLHAIGAGFLIYEIQQNSDTTYRVFDWNRVGLDGEPRELHIEKSMQSIDFNDYEPEMDLPQGALLTECEYFRVEKLKLGAGDMCENAREDRFSIFTVVEGELQASDGQIFRRGDFFLLPRGGGALEARIDSVILRTTV